MELNTQLLLGLMPKTKESSKSNHRNKTVLYVETGHLFVGSKACVTGIKFLKLVLIADEPVFWQHWKPEY